MNPVEKIIYLNSCLDYKKDKRGGLTDNQVLMNQLFVRRFHLTDKKE